MRTITRLSAVSIALLATATGESQAAPPTFDATRTGYWSVIFFNDTGNSIYATSPATRSFFRFDPASVGDADVVTSAVLSITRHQSSRGNEPVEQIGLFDVSTDQAVLHDTKFGLGYRTDIAELVFEDLGTGANFGEFNVGATETPKTSCISG